MKPINGHQHRYIMMIHTGKTYINNIVWTLGTNGTSDVLKEEACSWFRPNKCISGSQLKKRLSLVIFNIF